MYYHVARICGTG